MLDASMSENLPVEQSALQNRYIVHNNSCLEVVNFDWEGYTYASHVNELHFSCPSKFGQILSKCNMTDVFAEQGSK
jgi:hypothetical protein